MTTLRQRLIDDLKVRNRSAHTIKAYVVTIFAYSGNIQWANSGCGGLAKYTWGHGGERPTRGSRTFT